MIIYSVEISINKKVHEKWFKWMHDIHIPDVMKTNMFLKFKFYKNLDAGSFKNYIIQYETDEIRKYSKYISKFSIQLQKDHSTIFRNQFSAKRSLFIKI